jgi:glucosyl-3-phosphoglycerate phosphatase
MTDRDRLPRVYLVRHGETEWNVLEKLISFTDHGLNARGQAQARRLGRELAAEGIEFDRVMCSPKARASETARLVLAALPGSPAIEHDDRLVEVDFGPLEGWTSAQIAADAAATAWRRGADYPGAETNAQTIARARSFWADVPATGTTLVVGHGRFLRYLVCACVLGMPMDEPPRMRMRNCRPAIVEPGPRPLLLALNGGPPYRQ